MKYFNMLLLTTAFSMNAGFASAIEEADGSEPTAEQKAQRAMEEANKLTQAAVTHLEDAEAIAIPHERLDLTETETESLLNSFVADITDQVKKLDFPEVERIAQKALDMTNDDGTYTFSKSNRASLLRFRDESKELIERSAAAIQKRLNGFNLDDLAFGEITVDKSLKEKLVILLNMRDEKSAFALEGKKRMTALIALAKAHYQAGKIAKTKQLLISQLAKQEFVGKHRAISLFLLGMAHSKLQEFPEAITHLTAALGMRNIDGTCILTEEKRANCLTLLGGIYLGQDKLNDAITQYTAALDKRNVDGAYALNGLDRVDCITMLGSTYFEQEKFNEAQELYTAALDMRNIDGAYTFNGIHRSDLLRGVVNAYKCQGDFASCIAPLTELVATQGLPPEDTVRYSKMLQEAHTKAVLSNATYEKSNSSLSDISSSNTTTQVSTADSVEKATSIPEKRERTHMDKLANDLRYSFTHNHGFGLGYPITQTPDAFMRKMQVVVNNLKLQLASAPKPA